MLYPATPILYVLCGDSCSDFEPRVQQDKMKAKSVLLVRGGKVAPAPRTIAEFTDI